MNSSKTYTPRDLSNFLMEYWGDSECVNAATWIEDQFNKPKHKRNSYICSNMEFKAKNMSYYINGLMNWIRTPQGKYFWRKIYDRAKIQGV